MCLYTTELIAHMACLITSGVKAMRVSRAGLRVEIILHHPDLHSTGFSSSHQSTQQRHHYHQGHEAESGALQQHHHDESGSRNSRYEESYALAELPIAYHPAYRYARRLVEGIRAMTPRVSRHDDYVYVCMCVSIAGADDNGFYYVYR